LSSSDVVYHYTDTVYLPWILANGELQPSVTDLFPDVTPLRYLWGTTNPLGDYTTRPLRQIHQGGLEEEWQAGVFDLVRFTLPANAFLSFSEILQFSDWTPEQAAALVEYDRRAYGETGHDMWRCRQDPLRLADVLKVETTSFGDAETERWRPLDIRRPERLLIRSRKPNRLGVRIGRRRFHSNRFERPDRWGSHYCVPWPEAAVTRAKRLQAAYEARMDAAMIARWDAEEEYVEEEEY
jgi:hypothetical protein